MSRALLITGATGKQGGALINSLLSATTTTTTTTDFQILALTRNPTSPSAQRLASSSPQIKLLPGDLSQPDQIFAAARNLTATPIWGVYSVQSAMSLNPWDEAETRQGKALVDAALKNNVSMFVYSSVDRGGDELSYDNATTVPHFKTKHEIEHHLVESARGTDMAYTILRPTAFMDNLQPGFGGKAFTSTWDLTMPSSKSLQLVATSDIGYFGAQAFLHPDKFRNRAVSLAGDELTFDQFKQVYREKTGLELPVTYRFVAWLLTLISRDLRLMYQWFGAQGYGVDIAALRREYPGLKTFAQWLETESAFVERKAKD